MTELYLNLQTEIQPFNMCLYVYKANRMQYYIQEHNFLIIQIWFLLILQDNYQVKY
jgi:hypothetical protein